jgi:hypothetical protein
LIADHDRTWDVYRLEWDNRLIRLYRHRVVLDRREGDYVTTYIGPQVSLDLQGQGSAEDLRNTYFAACGPLAIYLTMMIHSRSTVLVTERAPEKLNLARLQKGKTPLASHRIVWIVPPHYLRERRREAGFSRLPPRLHYVRTHRRTYHRDEPNQFRITIWRHLVNPGGDEEVSHEYRIGPNRS